MKRNIFLTISLLTLSQVFFNSCNKDDKYLTIGEINTQNIQSVIHNEEINEVAIYGYNWSESSNEYRSYLMIVSSTFEITSPFIKLSGKYYYSLAKLDSYDTSNGRLNLYLDIIDEH